MALFGRGRPRPDDAARRRIAEWARMAVDLEPASTVTVNEIVCADPACPGTETVILVLRPGTRTRGFKVAKPVAEVTRDDVVAALAAASD